MITFIESPHFTRQVPDYLSDEEYAAFQAFLASSPDAGDVVKGSGGVRKIRWKRKGVWEKRRGKSHIFYAPAVRRDLAPADLREKRC